MRLCAFLVLFFLRLRHFLRFADKEKWLSNVCHSLDAHTEKVVNDLIKTEFREWTVLVVTHRVKSVAKEGSGFDQVVVLQRGRVVEKGSPEDLMKKSGSLFSGMVQMQE